MDNIWHDLRHFGIRFNREISTPIIPFKSKSSTTYELNIYMWAEESLEASENLFNPGDIVCFEGRAMLAVWSEWHGSDTILEAWTEGASDHEREYHWSEEHDLPKSIAALLADTEGSVLMRLDSRHIDGASALIPIDLSRPELADVAALYSVVHEEYLEWLDNQAKEKEEARRKTPWFGKTAEQLLAGAAVHAAQLEARKLALEAARVHKPRSARTPAKISALNKIRL